MGWAAFGSSAARSLVASGHKVLAIEEDEDLVQALAGELPHVVRADATDLAALRQLSVTDFAHAVVGIKRRHQDFIHAKADTEVKPGDHLIVAGPTPRIKAFAALC